MNLTPEGRDAARGVLWEGKWRGTLDAGLTPDVVRRSAKWLGHSPPAPLPPAPVFRPGVGWGTYGWKYGPAAVLAAVEAGAVVIDTAEGYGFGRVEKELGDATGGDYGTSLLATKASRNHLRSGAAVRAAALRSRDRLRVETIGLYQLHWPVFTAFDDVLDALAGLLGDGVIGAVGVSNFCAGQLAVACDGAAARGFRIVSNQIRLSVRDRENAEYLLPYCRAAGVTVLAHSPLGQGAVRRAKGDPAADLRGLLAEGVIPIPGSNDPDHVRSNLAVISSNEKTPP